MKRAGSSETLSVHQTVRRHISQDYQLEVYLKMNRDRLLLNSL